MQSRNYYTSLNRFHHLCIMQRTAQAICGLLKCVLMCSNLCCNMKENRSCNLHALSLFLWVRGVNRGHLGYEQQSAVWVILTPWRNVCCKHIVRWISPSSASTVRIGKETALLIAFLSNLLKSFRVLPAAYNSQKIGQAQTKCMRHHKKRKDWPCGCLSCL